MITIDENAWYTRQDIMKLLNIKSSTFAKVIKDIEHCRSGRQVFCRGKHLNEYLEHCNDERDIMPTSRAMEKVDRLCAIK